MSLLNPNLQAFLAIFKTSTVTGAAKQLNIGQTGVTQRIRALERELGVTLFLRSRTGMTLTSEGRTLLKYCLKFQEIEGETLSHLKNSAMKADVDVRIAGPTSFISGRAVPSCKPLFAKWPHLNLHFLIDDRENRIELLKNGSADIVVLAPHQVPLELDSRMIQPDEYLLLGCPTWKRRDLSEILGRERLFAFHPDDHTSLNYLKQFDLLKFLKRPRLFANENLALSTLLRAGVGVGILSLEIARPLLKRRELIMLNQGKTMRDPLALAWYPRTEMPNYLSDIINAI